MEYSYQNSVIAQILEAIINASTYEGETGSNIADILLSILNETPYEGAANSVLAELFLELKAKIEGDPFTPYEGTYSGHIAEILLSILNETEYTAEPQSRIAELLLQLKEELEAYTEVTVSGAIANFTTNVSKPLVNLTSYFNATQEAGTPTPQSPKAISGVSADSVYQRGANLFDEVMELGSISNTTGEDAPHDTYCRSKNYIAVPLGQNLYISNENAYTLGLRFYDKNKAFIGARAFLTSKVMTYGTQDLPTNTAFIRIVNTSANTYSNDISINYPSSDTEYHAYNTNSSTTLINLGGTYYGGYVTQDKAGHRQFEVTHSVKLFSELDFRRSNSSGSWSFYVFFAQMSDKTIKSVVKCSNYAYVAQSIASMQNETITSGSSNEYIYIRDDNYTTVEAFKTANANTQLLYELAEPFTVALPDGEPITAFNGVNNIYNDSGDTSVTYLYKGEPPLQSPLGFGLGSSNSDPEEENIEEATPIEETENSEEEA